MIKLDAKVPKGPIQDKWTNHKFDMKLINPANKRKYDVIVVGTGLAGAAAAATLGELGYNVQAFTFHDSPRHRDRYDMAVGARSKGSETSMHRDLANTVYNFRTPLSTRNEN